MAFSALMQELILPVSKEDWMGIVLVTLGISGDQHFRWVLREQHRIWDKPSSDQTESPAHSILLGCPKLGYTLWVHN